MAGLSIAAASSQAWASMGAQAETALNNGWILDQTVDGSGAFATLAAPSTATAFLSSGDGTTGSGNSFWSKGRRARVVHTGGTAYAYVGTATFAAGVTTVGLQDWTSGGTTSLSTTAVTSAAAGPLTAGLSGNLGRVLVSRYSNNATLTITNAASSSYVDFGGSFTTTVTTLAGDVVVLGVQSVFRKLTGGNAAIVVDRSGTVLPSTVNPISMVFTDMIGSFVPYFFYYIDSPSSGTYTYKPQLYTNDANSAATAGGLRCQFVVEVWR